MSASKFSVNDIPSLEGKIVLVTGGNTGIGKETILQLAKHQPKQIFLAARTESKALDAITDITKQVPEAKIQWLPLDLSSLPSIKSAAEKFDNSADRLDILILNAGIMATDPGKTEAGQDLQIGTNHVGHFLLTKLLLPKLQSTASQPDSDVRIVTVSSSANEMSPSIDVMTSTEKLTTKGPWRRYGASKAANIVFAAEFARKYPSITSVSIHPGVIMTDLWTHTKGRNWLWASILNTVQPYFSVSVPEGALNQIWASVGARKSEIKNGQFYYPVGQLKNVKWAQNELYGRQLWGWTEKELAAAGY